MAETKKDDTARTVFQFHFHHAFPPVFVVRRFRVWRFGSGSLVTVEGEFVSEFCFRFSDALEIAGVLVAPDDTVGDVTTVEDDEEIACTCCCCVGIVLCCF